jgi:hypothetical protein
MIPQHRVLLGPSNTQINIHYFRRHSTIHTYTTNIIYQHIIFIANTSSMSKILEKT